jgi:predicted outer membrane lipoprotein
MRTFIRSVIAIVAGFLLMWPLGYAYVALSWPTFHFWGLMHGSFVAAWPALSILAYLALGYLPPFQRIDDTPLLIAGLVWGVLLASAFNIRNALGFEITYGLLGATAVVVAILCLFARQRLRLALLTISPVVFLSLDFLLTLPSTFEQFLSQAKYDLKAPLPPLAFALAGYALGSLARALIKRSPTTAH